MFSFPLMRKIASEGDTNDTADDEADDDDDHDDGADEDDFVSDLAAALERAGDKFGWSSCVAAAAAA